MERDADLVREVQRAPDAEAGPAFGVLFARWQGRVFHFVRRLVHSREDAEDITAEVFLRAWKHIRSLRDPERWAPWLLRIARNRVNSHHERRSVRNPVFPVDARVLDDLVVEAPRLVRDDLREALATLPPGDLSILREKYIDGLTYVDIGRRQGIAVSTVRDRLMKARDSLSGVLRRAGVLEEFAAGMAARRKPGKGKTSEGGIADV